MIFIIEGENKCGKTTLANKICSEFGFEYVKCSQPKGDPYIEYMEILRKIERSGKDTVIDRFLYGEFVYGPIYRGKSMLTMEQKRNIELKALSLDTIMVYCHDDVDKIAKRFKAENEEFADVSKIERTLKLYADILEETNVPYLTHRMRSKDDLTKNKRLSKIITTMRKCNDVPRLKTAVGNVKTPTFIFVGEKRNENLKKEYSKYHQPFDFGVSSQYLFNEIASVGIPLCYCMFINSDSKELKKLNDNKYIISLGRVAEKELAKLKMCFEPMNHPSYERRFHGKKHRIAKSLAREFQDIIDDINL